MVNVILSIRLTYCLSLNAFTAQYYVYQCEVLKFFSESANSKILLESPHFLLIPAYLPRKRSNILVSFNTFVHAKIINILNKKICKT